MKKREIINFLVDDVTSTGDVALLATFNASGDEKTGEVSVYNPDLDEFTVRVTDADLDEQVHFVKSKDVLSFAVDYSVVL